MTATTPKESSFTLITDTDSKTPITTTSSSLTMVDSTLLTKARKAHFDDLPSFSGHPSEDVERFLRRIKYFIQITDDSPAAESLAMVRGKLTNSAGYWFDRHRSDFSSWSDFETAFRERYFSKNTEQQTFTKLHQRRQQRGETVTSYFDDVVDLCYEIDPDMPESLILRYLLNGLRADYCTELYRRASSIKTLNDFLSYAKVEQDLQDTVDSVQHTTLDAPSSQSTSAQHTVSTVHPNNKPFQPRPRSSTQQYQSHSRPSNSSSQSHYRRPNPRYQPRSNPSQPNHPSTNTRQPTKSNDPPTQTPSQGSNPSQPDTQPRQATNSPRVSARPQSTPMFSPCKVCARKNHRTIDCFYKRRTGCFNCGNDHHVRDCTLPPSFQ